MFKTKKFLKCLDAETDIDWTVETDGSQKKVFTAGDITYTVLEEYGEYDFEYTNDETGTTERDWAVSEKAHAGFRDFVYETYPN